MEFICFGVVRPTAIGAIVDLLALPLIENLGLLALPQIFEDTESLSYFTFVFKLSLR